MKKSDEQSYMELIEERRKQGRVTTPHQLIGLELAKILDDERHKSLYIKLAKEHDNHSLLILAKNIAEKPNVINKGAYFMRMLTTKMKEKR